MNLARQIEEGRASMQVIQGTVKDDGTKSPLSKYDPLIDVLSDGHQLVLGVLQDVPYPEYHANTPLPQDVLDEIFTRGPHLLKIVDCDMLTMAKEKGNFNGNVIYSALSKLRKSLEETLRNYNRLIGTV